MTDQELLTRAVELSGLSAQRFATEVLIRDPRSMRRWLAGKRPLPLAVRDYLTRRLEETSVTRTWPGAD